MTKGMMHLASSPLPNGVYPINKMEGTFKFHIISFDNLLS